jgi:hypothetical protein
VTEVGIEVALPAEFQVLGKSSTYLHTVVQRAMELGAWGFPFSADTVSRPDHVPVAVGLAWNLDDSPADVHRVVAALRTQFDVEYAVVDGRLIAADTPAPTPTPVFLGANGEPWDPKGDEPPF